MKQISLTLFILLGSVMYGQSKYNYVHFDKLIDVEGSEYVIASAEDRGKMATTKEKHLLFINTLNGETHQVDFHKDAYIREIKQIKIDKLGINLIVIAARTIDLDGKKSIGWGDPMQIIVLSPDGKERVSLTEDKFFVRSWTVNEEAGRIVIVGHYDTNGNGKYDKTDESQILIYDLKTLKLAAKI